MDKSIPKDRVKKGDTETSIRIRIQPDIKERLIANQEKAGFKSISQFLVYRGLEEVPPRKAPAKERLALIKALASLGHIMSELKARPEDTSKIEAQITKMAEAIHGQFNYDS